MNARESFASPAARILIVDDVPANLNLLTDALETAGHKIMAAPNGKVALKIATTMPPDLILLDILMPGMDGYEVCRQFKANTSTRDIPIIFLTAKDETDSIVQGFEVGGVDYIAKPFQTDEVLSRVNTHLKIHQLTQQLKRKNEELEAEIGRRQKAESALQSADEQLSMISAREAERWGIAAFIGKSDACATIIQQIRRLQNHPGTNVLITGESGTGKELIARAIHYGSARARRPFVPVNCAAIPAELTESSFFGHTKGAFTGAGVDHAGYFEQAQGGTLFLDEIGEMPTPLQSKLLRELEDGVVTRVGGTTSRKIDCRVISSTNADVLSEIAARRFRNDLYFRLAQFTIEVPPLRERRDDIPLLATHFLEAFASEMGLPHPAIQPAALDVLLAHDFPGNVREFKNLIESALIESDGADLSPEHLRLDRTAQSVLAAGEGAALDGPSAPPVPACRLPTETETIVGYVREHGSINNSECRVLLGVGLHRASNLLRRLHRAGVLTKESSRRWTQYRLA